MGKQRTGRGTGSSCLEYVPGFSMQRTATGNSYQFFHSMSGKVIKLNESTQINFWIILFKKSQKLKILIVSPMINDINQLYNNIHLIFKIFCGSLV